MARLVLASFILMLLPKVSLSASAMETIPVGTPEEFQAAANITEATIINLTANIVLSEDPSIYYDVGDYFSDVEGSTTVTSKEGYSLTVTRDVWVWHDLIFEDLAVDCVADGVFDCQASSIIVHSGTFSNLKINTATSILVQPTGETTITNCNVPVKIEPQEGYSISVKVNGETVDASNGYMCPAESSISIQEAFDPSAGNATADGVAYAWGYGGTITEDSGTFTVTAYEADGFHYVIDTLVVDGAAVPNVQGAQTQTISASSSVFATFACVLDF